MGLRCILHDLHALPVRIDFRQGISDLGAHGAQNLVVTPVAMVPETEIQHRKASGAQRLPRPISKSKAMDLVLTGRMMNAEKAERAGLASRVVSLEKLMEEALGAGLTICDYGHLAVMAGTKSVNRALEDRRFRPLFAGSVQKEGTGAFANKRKVPLTHR